MPSMKRIKEWMNEFCGIIDRSAVTPIDKADAELKIQAIAGCYHWIETQDKWDRKAKEQERCNKTGQTRK